MSKSILDFWITTDLFYIQKVPDGSLQLVILSEFKKETIIKLAAADTSAFKVSGDWIYIVASDGLHIYSRHGDHVCNLNMDHSLQQVSLAFDAFEQLVAFSTDEAFVFKREGLQKVVQDVLNELYETAIAKDIISKEQGWVLIRDVKNNVNFAHWRAHTKEVLKISFSSSGLKVFTSTLGSNTFHIWDLVNMTDQQPSLVYVLSRGYTPATIYDISWTKNDTWLSVSTSHGTSHLFFLNPFVTESNTKPKNQSPEIRVKRPLQQDRRDFLAYLTAFVHPCEVVDDSVLLSLVSALSNNVFTINTFEITGSFNASQHIAMVQSNNLPLENEEVKSDIANIFHQSNTKPSFSNSWNSLVSIESYQTQPFWSINNVSFFTFEEDPFSAAYKDNGLDLTEYTGIKPFSIIESVALPNG
jgi:WD40 repeat protein